MPFSTFQTEHTAFHDYSIEICKMLREFPRTQHRRKHFQTVNIIKKENLSKTSMQVFPTRKTLVQVPEFLIKKNVNIIYVENC